MRVDRWSPLTRTALWFALLGLCGAVGAVALGTAVALWRGSERQEPDPRGRIWFLAVSALLIDGLFLALIVLTGIGAIVLDPCDR